MLAEDHHQHGMAPVRAAFFTVLRESHRSTLKMISPPCLRFTRVFRILMQTIPITPVVQVLLKAALP